MTFKPSELDRKSDRSVVGERLSIDGNELFLLGTPALTECLPDDLTKAEKDVAALVLEGLSNREIAKARGTSVRTIANQVAAIFRKLKVTARVELGQAVLRGRLRTHRHSR
jgi:DNA-binding NarL/FixJ family response regulator